MNHKEKNGNSDTFPNQILEHSENKFFALKSYRKKPNVAGITLMGFWLKDNSNTAYHCV